MRYITSKTDQKKVEIAILISDETEFKAKRINEDIARILFKIRR